MRLGARLHDAALALDAGRVGVTLAEAGALLDLETLWEGVIAPVLVRLGADWACGAATPAPEHLLSNAVRGRLWSVLEAQPRLPGRPVAVVGAGPDEPHDLAALMLSLLLSQQGWNVTFLGAATPPDAWMQAIETVRPRVVVASATMSQHAAATLAMLRAVYDHLGQHRGVLAYGGPAFEGLDRDAVLMRLEDNVRAATLSLGAHG
jgi:methylmalonyl-CoA mutase cobalamin-binding subunit